MNFLPWSHVKNHKTSRVNWVRRRREKASRQRVCLPWLSSPSRGLHLVLCCSGLSVLILFLCYRSLQRRQCSDDRQSFSDRFSILSPTQPHSMALSAPEAVSLPPFKELSLLVTRENSCLSVSEQATHCAGVICVLNCRVLIVKDEI